MRQAAKGSVLWARFACVALAGQPVPASAGPVHAGSGSSSVTATPLTVSVTSMFPRVAFE
jgi:hypothetical protein